MSMATMGAWLDDAVVADLWWRERGACRGMWNEVDFFPARGASAAPAKRVCMTCDVRLECLTDALRRKEREGVWGGTVEKDRRPLLRRIAAGEDIKLVVASTVPRIRGGWRPSTPASAAYQARLLARSAVA